MMHGNVRCAASVFARLISISIMIALFCCVPATLTLESVEASGDTDTYREGCDLCTDFWCWNGQEWVLDSTDCVLIPWC